MSTHLNSDITDVPPQTNEDVNKKQDRNVSNKLTYFGTYTNGKDSKDTPYIDDRFAFPGFRRNTTVHYKVGKVGRLYGTNPELEYIYPKGEFDLKEYTRADRKGVYYLERDSVSWEVVTNKALDPNKPTTGLECFKAERFGFDKFNVGISWSMQPLEKEVHDHRSDLFLPLPPPSLSSTLEVDLDNVKVSDTNGGLAYVRLSRQAIGDRLQLSECFPVKECALPLRKAEHVINEMIVLDRCETNEEDHLPGPLV
ncbi:hypothetical protein DdX_11838 [Ditylenchus destructor]|uniref:Uncharacterized protein n=1 Tax=Ditylenchus destructor TaxID=166010 RepID=A0AAD4MVH9_9BILA|nr:hypothetical protein DdX_11838 [Ditylenchus destructor]